MSETYHAAIEPVRRAVSAEAVEKLSDGDLKALFLAQLGEAPIGQEALDDQL